MRTRLVDDAGDVLEYVVRHPHLQYRVLQGRDVRFVQKSRKGLQLVRVEASQVVFEQHELRRLAGVANLELQQEAIQLRFRQRVGALGLDRVLGGNHQKWPRQ